MDSQLQGAELASLLKGQLGSNMNFGGLSGVDDPSLHLSEADIKWWRDAKFGMFIHWGIYTLLEKGEWVYFNDGWEEQAYRDLAKQAFHPEQTAEEIEKGWIDAAADAGMQYAVMVTRHHDGYALWDSKCSYHDFTSVSCGSGEDYVKAFVRQTKEKGLYTGLYYSPMDWRFAGYFDPKGKPESALQMKQQAYGQIEELCKDYGKLDILWYDGGWLAHTGSDADAAWLWEPLKLAKMVRSYNPKTMMTPRSGYIGDFESDEGHHAVKGQIVPIPWEKCMPLNEHWSYVGTEAVIPYEAVITMLVNAVCRDGNLLLNAAPDKNGRIPQESLDVLHRVGDWLKENGEAIYETRAGVWQPVDDIYGSTQKGDAIYLHILDPKKFADLILPAIDKTITHAKLLNGTPVCFAQNENGVTVTLPQDCKHEIDTIVKLTVTNEVK